MVEKVKKPYKKIISAVEKILINSAIDPTIIIKAIMGDHLFNLRFTERK